MWCADYLLLIFNYFADYFGAGRAPRAPGDPILEALGVDSHAKRAFFYRKSRMNPRTCGSARRAFRARGGMRAALGIRQSAPGSMSTGLLLGPLGLSWGASWLHFGVS